MKLRLETMTLEVYFCNGTWGLWLRGDRPVECSDLCIGPFHFRWRRWGGESLPWKDRPPQGFNCPCWIEPPNINGLLIPAHILEGDRDGSFSEARSRSVVFMPDPEDIRKVEFGGTIRVPHRPFLKGAPRS